MSSDFIASVVEFIKTIDFNFSLISSVKADDEPKKTVVPTDATGNTIYNIDPTKYPPFADMNKNVFILDTVTSTSATSNDRDLNFCANDLYLASNVINDNSTGGTCLNCVTNANNGGICKTSAGLAITGNNIHLTAAISDTSTGFASGIAGDMDTIEKMWNAAYGCFFTCNFEENNTNNCGVKKGYKRLYRSFLDIPLKECSGDLEYLEGYSVNAGGWSSAFRDWADGYKPYGWLLVPVIPDGAPSNTKAMFQSLKDLVGNLPDKKGTTGKSVMGSKDANINLCSIFVKESGTWVEYAGTTKTTKYYVNTENKTYCVPKLAFSDVTPPSGEYDGMGATATACSSKSGLDSCLGEIVKDGIITDILKGDGSQAITTTPIKELISNNKFDCSLFGGCTITAGIPPSCSDYREQETLYKKITDKSEFVATVDPTTSTVKPDSAGICPAGYRRSVTWIYDEIAFSNPGTATSATSYIFKKNCSFCEKVLYGASVLDQYRGEEDAKVTETGGGAPKAHQEAANYYLNHRFPNPSGPNTLGKGTSDKFVWHIDPMASVADSIALCSVGKKHNGKECVNPYTYGISSITLNMTDVDNLVKYKANKTTDDKIKYNTLKNLGLCPKGMIEVRGNNNNYITCLPYINKAQKVLCDADKDYEKFDNNQNILIDNTASNDSQYINNGVTGKQRYGCTIGNKMTYNETTKLFNCVTTTTSTGGSINKECRIGYGLQPVQVPAGYILNGVCTSGLGENCVAGIVFKCKQLREDGSYLPLLSCNDSLTNPSNAGASNISINICSSADADVTNKFSAPDSIKEDITSIQCTIDTASKSFKDEFEKTINYNRATMMFIIGDCKICM